jgi:hypothetical protein
MPTPADLIARIPGVTRDLSLALAGKADFYLWTGKIGKAPGAFWIPNLFDAKKLPDAVARLQTKDECSYFEAAGRMEKAHKGIGNKEIGLCPFAFVEMDDVGLDEQKRRLAELSAATGLDYALQVFSGGKSIHTYLAYAKPLLPDDHLRLRIQKLLVAILGGDHRIVDLPRLMRLPGYKAEDRQQPIIHCSDATYTATDILNRLQKHALSLGLDYEKEYERLKNEQLKRDAPTTSPTGTSNAPRLRVDGGYLPTADWIALTGGTAIGAQVRCPLCVGKTVADRKTLTVMTLRSAHCTRCNAWVREAVEESLPPGVLDCTFITGGTIPTAPKRPLSRPLVRPMPEAEVSDLKQKLDMAYAPRNQKKQGKANAVPPALREGAKKTLAYAANLVPLVRARRKGLGLPERPPEGTRCGVPLVLHHAGDGSLVGTPVCRDEDCPVHGPIHQARRIAAISTMPLCRSAAKMKKGLARTGAPLGERVLHAYRISPDQVGAFHDAWTRKSSAVNPANHSRSIDPATRNLPHSIPHGFVTFKHDDPGEAGRVVTTVLSTLKVEFRKGVSKLDGSYMGEITPTGDGLTSRQVIDALGIASIQVVSGGDVDGLDFDPVVETGTVTSSQTLHLDPEGTARVASGSLWHCIGEVSVESLKDAADKAGMVMVVSQTQDGTGERATTRAVTPSTARDLLASAGATRFGKPIAASAVPEEEMEAYVEALNHDVGDLLDLDEPTTHREDKSCKM